MNYKRHYALLIERAKNRKINTEFTEKHHIVPRCLNGNDGPDNLVDLYPEEHFLAHQLLAKIYPGNHSLIKAAAMMCVGHKQKRINNKLYGWLRKKLAKAMSESQTGRGNSQFGTCWVSNLETKESKKIDKTLLDNYLNNGWIKKRIINWNNNYKKRICPSCGKEFLSEKNTCSLSCGQKLFNKLNPKEFGKGKLDSMIEDYKKGYSIYRCLKNAGLDGTGKNHTRFKEIVKDL